MADIIKRIIPIVMFLIMMSAGGSEPASFSTNSDAEEKKDRGPIRTKKVIKFQNFRSF